MDRSLDDDRVKAALAVALLRGVRVVGYCGRCSVDLKGASLVLCAECFNVNIVDRRGRAFYEMPVVRLEELFP